LFNFNVLPPHVDPNPPNVSADAAVPFAVKSNVPDASVNVRAVPPNRVRCVPVSSTCNTAPFCTTRFPVAPVNCPAPEMFIVPDATVMFAVLEAAPVKFKVPEPIFVTLVVFGV
jgi:hypothetical protein